MHTIDDRFRGANALSPGDVNQDGFDDYVTNYEFDQRYVISFHPGDGPGVNVKEPWPTVVAWVPEPLVNGSGVNPEHAALGDFDGDGNLDVAAAQGWSNVPFWDGSEPGVRLIWGPPEADVFDESAWIDAGRIPETIDQGHFIFVAPYDVNGDGALDIVSGGRIHGGNQRKGGVIWIEGPILPTDRRILDNWHVHAIDPDQFCAHGLVFTDIDEDGDDDIVIANADWDTPEEEEEVVWYENPGTGSPAQKDPWTKHEIYKGSEFYAKPQIALIDLDQDGYDEGLFTQVAQDIYYFKKTGVAPVSWERIVIPKDPVAQWLGRPVRVIDINGDDRLDIVGMLIHEEGSLPSNKAAAYWMEYSGPAPQADNWTTHAIKWGSGTTMMMAVFGFGEKWDQVNFSDMDEDGDLDIIANCEEWWEDNNEYRFFFIPPADDPNSVAVVWFENRLNEAPYTWDEQAGLCVIEAEQYTDLRDGTWIERGRYAGYTGDGYMQAQNHLGAGAVAWQTTEGLVYEINLTGGTYHIWVRRWVPGSWGTRGAGKSDSAFLGVDGSVLDGVLDDQQGAVNEWSWVGAPAPVDLSAGTHHLSLRVREGGYAVDQILLTTDPGFVPSGTGP
jgi:hypothetical protein